MSLYDQGFMKLLAALHFAERVFYLEPRQFTSSFLFSSKLVSKITNRQQVVLFTVFYSIAFFRKSLGKQKRANIPTFLQKSGLKAVNLTSKFSRAAFADLFLFVVSCQLGLVLLGIFIYRCSSDSATYLLAARKST